MNILKIVFCVVGYVFAGAAVAGWCSAKHPEDDDEEDIPSYYILIGMIWPLYIAWIPVKAVYHAVKKQMIEQIKKMKKENEPSIPPGEFRIGNCSTCKKSRIVEDKIICTKKIDLGCLVYVRKDGKCNEYEERKESCSSCIHGRTNGNGSVYCMYHAICTDETGLCDKYNDGKYAAN